MISTLLSLCLSQSPALGPASLDFDSSGVPPEQPYSVLIGVDGGVEWAGVAIPGQPQVFNTDVWFKVGAVTPPGQVRVELTNGGTIRTAFSLVPHAWNRVRHSGGFDIRFPSVRIYPMYGTTFEVEALAQPSDHGARDDTPWDVPGPLLLPSGPVPRTTAAVVFGTIDGGDPYAPSCGASVTHVHGNAYTHFVRWPLGAGAGLSVPIIAGTLLYEPLEGADPTPVVRRLRMPTASDGGASLSYRISHGGETLTTGTIDVASGASVSTAEFLLGLDLPRHAVHDAGTAVLELRVLDGGVDVFAAATGDDPEGPCGAISRATWRGTESGAWIADAGHFDLAFDLEEAPRRMAFLDEDRDGFGNAAKPNPAHVPPYTSLTSSDCDDTRAAVNPGAQELCNGIDDDCDTAIDGQDSDLLLVPCGLDAGVCNAGVKRSRTLCMGGEWRACGTTEFGADYEAQESRCDGKDNDCDGQVDEVTSGPACALTKGVCAGAKASVCAMASWVACEPSAYGADYEVEESSCDGLDNDCDGQVDEPCVRLLPLGTVSSRAPKTGCASVAGMPLVLLALAWRRRRIR